MAGGAPGAPLPRSSALARVVIAPLLQFDRRRIDWTFGAVSAVFVTIPIALALTTASPTDGVLAALGAFNVFLGQGALDLGARRRLARWALALNGLGIALGTLAGLTGPAQLFVVAGVIAGLQLANLLPQARSVALTACALAAIGLGLPDASATAAIGRALVVVIGGAWGLLGTEVALRLRARLAAAGHPAPALLTSPPIGWRVVARAAISVGIASALAFGVGEWLGLPRDYWTVLSVVVVVQIHFLDTVSSAIVRVTGTIVGALVGAALSVAVVAPAAIAGLIAGFTGLTLAVRSASASAYVIFLTPFVLLVLGIAYPNGWSLAESRVLDTVIGGGFALGASGLLWLSSGRLLGLRRTASLP